VPGGKVELAGSGEIRADELDVRELYLAIGALRVEEVEQGSAAVLVGVGDGRAHAESLIVVVVLVRLETWARAASVSWRLRSMSMRVRCFSPWLRSKMRKGTLTPKPRVCRPLGLLLEAFQVYQLENVGSVEPLAMASLWLVPACWNV
jgi:hypothetical protein